MIALKHRYWLAGSLGAVVIGLALVSGAHAAPEQYLDTQLRLRQYADKGYQQLHTNDPKGAVANYTEAIKLGPKIADLHVSRGYARAMLKDYKGAIADQTEALRLDATLAEAYANRGTSRYRLGDRKGARSDWHRAAALFRQHKREDKADDIEEVLRQYP